MGAKKKPAPKKTSGSSEKKKSKPRNIWTLYEAKGELKRKNATCPKCGPGFLLAAHANRATCGKCGYTEMKKKE